MITIDFAAEEWTFLVRYAPALLAGLRTTLELNVYSIIAGCVGGTFLAALRMCRSSALQTLARFLCDIFRTLPLLVLIFWLFFALPMMPLIGIQLNPLPAAILALALNLSAFVAEILRAGIQGVPRQHIEAATIAGFNTVQLARYILGPLALRVMTPPLVGQLLNHVKLSVLASTIAVPELLHAVNTIANESFQPVQSYTTLAMLFLVILLPCTWAQARFERRFRLSDRAATRSDTAPENTDFDALPGLAAWPMCSSAITVTNLSVQIKTVTAVKMLSTTFKPGTITAVIGTNGCGKTTLLRSIARLIPLTDGVIEPPSEDLSFGLMFQEHEPWPHLSVLHNLVLPVRLNTSLSENASYTVCMEWLRYFDLDREAYRNATELSGGQKQRLALARVLCLRPSVLLLDEPTSAMDFRWSMRVYQALRSLADHGVCIIIVSHGMACLRSIADQILFMDDGTVIEKGAALDVLREPQTAELRAFLAVA